MLKCPNLGVFIAASPGAVVRPVSTLPTLVLSQGGQLLIDLSVAHLTCLVDGVAHGDGPTTFVPQLFLDCYSELPLVASLSFATVLPSPTEGLVRSISPPAASTLHLHGGLPSRPNPIGVNVAPSTHYASPCLGGYGLRLVPSSFQQIRSAPASLVSAAAHNYGGFFHTAEPSYGGGYYHHGCASVRYFHWGPLSAHSLLSDHGGCYLPSGDIPSFVNEGGPFPTCPGEFP